MTVSELIEVLKKMPQDLPVVGFDRDSYEYFSPEPWVTVVHIVGREAGLTNLENNDTVVRI